MIRIIHLMIQIICENELWVCLKNDSNHIFHDSNYFLILMKFGINSRRRLFRITNFNQISFLFWWFK